MPPLDKIIILIKIPIIRTQLIPTIVPPPTTFTIPIKIRVSIALQDTVLAAAVVALVETDMLSVQVQIHQLHFHVVEYERVGGLVYSPME